MMVAWQLAGRSALVVGGGVVAAQRVRSLVEAGARVTVVASRVHPGLPDGVEVIPRDFAAGDLDGRAVVCVAIDTPSGPIAAAARARGIPVNVADQPALCDFYFPAVHRDGPVQVAVSTGGAGPGLAARLRDEIAASLPPRVGDAVRRFGALRRALRTREPSPARRMREMGDIARAWSWRASPRATVTLVGAGPGDPELLTLAAVRALVAADLVIADRLVPDAILARVKGEVRIAGKRPGRADEAQAEIEAWMIEAARGGRRVVRLKIGDPALYGRLEEELAALSAHGIDAEVIPGVSSISALGIPLTARGSADRLLVCTGQGAHGRAPEVPAFRADTTVVFLMAMGRLPALSDALRAAGWPTDWPARAVSNASRPDERVADVTVGTLATLDLPAPGAVVVGRVTRLAPPVALRRAG